MRDFIEIQIYFGTFFMIRSMCLWGHIDLIGSNLCFVVSIFCKIGSCGVL